MLKKHRLWLFWLLSFLIPSAVLNAQCSFQAEFSLPDTLCARNDLTVVDLSYGLVDRWWDFYANDLNLGIAGSPVSLGGSAFINNTNGLSIEEEAGLYYGFAVNGTSKTITRISFLDSLTNPSPTFEDVIIPTPLISSASALRFYDNVAYIGEGGSSLVRVEFDNGIGNQPTNSSVFSNTALNEFSNPRNIRFIEENDSIFMIVANTGSKKHLSILTFGNSIANTPTLIRKVDSLNTTATNRYAFDLDVVKVCDNWLSYQILSGGDISIANFGNSLSSKPTLSLSNVGSTSDHRFTQVIQAEGVVYLIVQRQSGRIRVYNFGADGLDLNPSFEEYIGVFGSGNTRGFQLEKIESAYHIFGLNYNANEILSNNFGNANLSPSALDTSSVLNSLPYTTPGRYYIELMGTDSAGRVSTSLDSIDIIPSISPAISISGGCIDKPVGFNDQSFGFGLSPIAWSWDFGDGDTSIAQNTTHAYLDTGEYVIEFNITANNGCVTTAFDSVKVSDLRPENPDFGYSPNIVCENTIVTFYDSTVVIEDSVISYLWDFGDGDSSNLASPNHQYATAGNYTVTLYVTGRFGCDTSVVRSVPVQAGPSPGFIAENFCAGAPTSFTDSSSTQGLSSIVAWLWDFGDGDTSIAQNPVHTFNNSGTYDIILQVETDSGCVASNIIPLQILAPPQPNFAYNTPCALGEVSLTDISSGNIIAWEWYNANNPIDSNSSATFTFPAVGFEDIRLTIENSSGCIDSITQTIEIFPALLSDFEFDQICIGDSTQFTATTPSFSVISQQWDFGFFNQGSTAQNPSFYYPSTGSYTVSLSVENAIGCVSDTTKIVEIRKLPIVEFIAENACIGTNTSLIDQSQVLNGLIVDQVWQVDGNTLFGDSINYIFDAAQTYPISLQVEDNFGCVNAITSTFEVFDVPEVDFSFSPNYGEAPIDISFSNQSSTNAVDFFWDFGDGVGTSIEVEPVYSYSTNGTYTILLRGSNAEGCADSSFKEIPIIPTELDLSLSNFSIQKTTLADGSLAYQPSVLLQNVGTRAIFNAELLLSVNNETSIAETWEGILPVGQSVFYTLDNFALIKNLEQLDYLCLEAGFVNDNTELNLSNNKTCLIQQGAIQTSLLYPNPGQNEVHLDVIMENDDEISIEIYDLNGRLVLSSKNIALLEGYNKLSIATSSLQAGKYVVYLNYNDEIISHSLIIENP